MKYKSKIGLGIGVFLPILALALLFFSTLQRQAEREKLQREIIEVKIFLDEVKCGNEGSGAFRELEKEILRQAKLEEKRRIEEVHRHERLENEVDRIIEQMDKGSIAFNVPRKINIDDFSQIQLILSLVETEKELKSHIVAEGEKAGASIRVSKRMQAHLSGPMFHITAITPEVQAVSEREQTEWKWEIYPSKEGKHKLHLALTALLEINGHSTPRSIRTFDKIIEVNVTATQNISILFKNNWQWLWATILVPVAVWRWKRRKNS